MNVIIGNVVMALGVILIAIGMFGLLKFKKLSVRILIAAKVDTVGFITVMLGAMIHSGFSGHMLKFLLIMVFTVITNPLVTQAIAHSAHANEYPLEEDETPNIYPGEEVDDSND